MTGFDRLDQQQALARASDLVRVAQALGAVEAEVFCKWATARAVVLEPDPSGAGKPRTTLSSCDEEGLALRILDKRGRWGFAWRSPFPAREGDREKEGGARGLVLEALASAQRTTGRRRAGSPPTRARWSEPDLAPGPARDQPDLALTDPEFLVWPVDRVVSRLTETEQACRGLAGDAALVDKVRMNEARLTIALANSRGFVASYQKDLAHLSISVVPAIAGSRTVYEERSSCRVIDLDPRECGIEAALRSLPSRPPAPPPAESLPVVFGPRAAAALIAAIAPLTLPVGRGAGAPEEPPEPLPERRRGLWLVDEADRPGAAGSSPFDGVGERTRSAVIMAGGRETGRIVSEPGHQIRSSYREPPAAGLTNLRLLATDDAAPGLPETACLRVEAAQFVPGPTWAIRVVRGDWHDGEESKGPADGHIWFGPPETIVNGVAAAGNDHRLFQIGVPIAAPTLTVEGLRGWRVEARPAAVRRPQPPFAGRSRSKRE